VLNKFFVKIKKEL